MRERRSLVPIGILEIQVEEEFGLFAALFETGRLFQKLGSLGVIALGRMRSRFDDNGGQIVGLKF